MADQEQGQDRQKQAFSQISSRFGGLRKEEKPKAATNDMTKDYLEKRKTSKSPYQNFSDFARGQKGEQK